MKRLAAIALIMLAAGCSKEGGPAPSAQGCALHAEQPFTLTNAAAPDIATAQSFGATCDQAALLLTLRDANGDLLWAFAGGYHDLVHGGPPTPGADPTTPQQVQSFLDGWAKLTITDAGTLPEWKIGAARPGEGEGPFAYSTPLDRDVYEHYRAEKSALACFAAGAETSRCLFVDPATGAPALMADYGP